jgi:hypothetical protein
LAKPDVNPLEDLTHRMADKYSEMVLDLTEHLAPFRPWWHVDLTPDQKLWRYQESRVKFMPWLSTVMPYMGWESWDEALGELEDLFFSAKADAAVPITLQAMVPVELLRLVQAEPVDAAKHIRDMERLLESRIDAIQLLAREEASEESKEIFNEEIPEPPGRSINPPAVVNDVPLTPPPSTGGYATPPA